MTLGEVLHVFEFFHHGELGVFSLEASLVDLDVHSLLNEEVDFREHFLGGFLFLLVVLLLLGFGRLHNGIVLEFHNVRVLQDAEGFNGHNFLLVDS